MSSASLANLSETLAWLAVLSYVVAAVLFGLELAYRVRWVGRAGLAVAVAGLAANVGAAVARALAAGRVPWGNMYEFSVMVGIVTVAAFLVWVARRPAVRPLGALPRGDLQRPVPGQGALRAAGRDAGPAAGGGRRPHRRPGRGPRGGRRLPRGGAGAGAVHRCRAAGAVPPRVGPAAVRGHARRARLPDHRVRLPDLDVRDHRRGDLGAGGVGPLLGLGPQGDLVLHKLDDLRRLPAR